MRPTPAETVAGVARILREVVAPAVTDAHARAQLAQAIAVLGQVEWDHPVGVVRSRLAATEELLAQCRAWVDADPSRAAAFPGWPDDGLPAEDAPFAEVNARLAQRRGVLAAFVEALRAWRAEHGPDSSQALVDLLAVALAGAT